MPGARPSGFRPGDSAELLAEFILGSMAFTTKVPRQEDVGHDLLCVFSEKTGNLLKAGPFFTVQVKSKKENLVYEKEHEIKWIKNQENPFFICVVDRNALSVELYSTWNMLNAFLYRDARRIVLVPGGPGEEYKEPTTLPDGGEQVIPLGRPILRLSAQEVMNEERVIKSCTVFKQWIELDRENIVNTRAGMFWVVGPTAYETNEFFPPGAPFRIAFFWNPQNLDKCKVNFGRSATALRVVIRHALGVDGEDKPGVREMITDLDQVLRSYYECLEPLSKDTLRSEVGLDIT